MGAKLTVRFGAIILLVGSVLACAVEMGRLGQGIEPSPSSMRERNDPLADELARCRALGAEGVNDSACKTAWAKNRERFFTQSLGHAAESAPAGPQKPSPKLPSEVFPDRGPPGLWSDTSQTHWEGR